MSVQNEASLEIECPECGRRGRSVKPLTLRALLSYEAAAEVVDADYRFCDATDCDTVYYGNASAFTKSQLIVPVGVKEIDGERRLCYCFGHSVGSIKEELRMKGRCDALEDIRRKMKEPGCRCETENPSGSCCLGSIMRGIESAQEELGIRDMVLQADIASSSSSSHGETVAKVGTVVSAIVASSCCWLPIVLLAVGVSGAGIASTLEAYRPLFIVVTFGFLAAAFHFTYRPKTPAGDRPESCASQGVEDCCSPAGKRRFNMKTMNEVVLWCVTVLAVAFLLFPNYVGAFLGHDDDRVTGSMNRTVLSIEGMTCEGCSAVAAQAIRGVPGVLAVEVSYEDGLANVGTEACCPFPKDAVLRAIERTGYTGAIKETREK